MRALNYFKNNPLLLFLIAITILKGLVWVFIIPIFQAPDEHRHYATIQHYAEPADYQPQSHDFPAESMNFFDIKTHNLSPELRHFLENIEFENTMFNYDAKNNFNSHSSSGINERKIRSTILPRFVERYPPQKNNYAPLYYAVGSLIENALASHGFNIIEKTYLIRLFSIFIFIIFIIVTYFIFKELSFSKLESVMLSTLVSFQPMLTFIGSIINVDVLLILAFAIFLLGGLRIINGQLNKLNILLLLAGTALAIHTKLTGFFLAPSLIVVSILFTISNYSKITKYSKKRKGKIAVIFILIILTLVIAYLSSLKYVDLYMPYLTTANLPLEKLINYIKFHFQLPVSLDRSFTYWGNYGSPNVPISSYYVFVIWLILSLAFFGFLQYIYQQIKTWKNIDSKNKTIFYQAVFLSFMLAGHWAMLHFINFVFANPENFTDPFASIGTPGRYFFPALVAKVILVIWGLAFLFRNIKREKIIFSLLVIMIVFHLMSIFNHVIPRYYL